MMLVQSVHYVRYSNDVNVQVVQCRCSHDHVYIGDKYLSVEEVKCNEVQSNFQHAYCDCHQLARDPS